MKLVVISGSHRRQSEADADRVRAVLEDADELYVGDAGGVDAIAIEYARGWIQWYRFRADWARLGKGAGPDRNARMILAARDYATRPGAEVVVHAFPGPDSVGTHDLIRRAREAGLTVHVHEVSW